MPGQLQSSNLPDVAFPTLSVGDVLSTTARVIGANFVRLLMAALVCLLPAIAIDALNVIIQFSAMQSSFGELAVWTYAIGAVRFLCGFLAQGAVMFITVQYVAGTPANLGKTLKVLGASLLFVAGTALLECFLSGLGLLFFVIPGVIALCAFYVAIPACVTERLSPIRALYRSAELTHAYRVKIFVVFLVAALIGWAIHAFTGFAMSALIKPGSTTSDLQSLFATKALLQLVSDAAVRPLTTLLGAVPPAVVYVRLRGLREGLDAHTIAEAFA